MKDTTTIHFLSNDLREDADESCGLAFQVRPDGRVTVWNYYGADHACQLDAAEYTLRTMDVEEARALWRECLDRHDRRYSVCTHTKVHHPHTQDLDVWRAIRQNEKAYRVWS